MAENDFDIDSLAAYLHMMPDRVMRLADRGKIPGRKVAGQWRFSRPEIHHWLEARIGLLDDDELVHVESALLRSAMPGEDQPIRLSELLSPDSIAVPLVARTKNKVITAMCDLAARSGLLWDPAAMADAVRAREEMLTTATEVGAALLHPRRPLPNILSQAMLALGVTASGIPFGGGGMTDVYFLICSTSDQQHLRVLARLSRLIGDPKRLAEIREAADAAAVHELISAWDDEFE